MNLRLKTSTALVALAFAASPALADMEGAKAFLDSEIGDLSSLSRADQEAEMQWFIDAAAPLAGMEIKVVSETIDTHSYESKVLAPAFTAITGIQITCVAQRIRVFHGAFEHIGDRLNPPVWVPWEAFFEIARMIVAEVIKQQERVQF